MEKEKAMTKSEMLLANLPATSSELCAALETTPKKINGMIYILTKAGKVKKDPVFRGHSEKRGPKPCLWVRV